MLKDAYEARLGKKVPSDHCGLGLARGARRGADQPLRGRLRRQDPVRAAQGVAVEAVGAAAGRMGRVAGRMAKLEVSWQDGVFFWYRSLSGEVVVGTADGVLRTRTVRRRPEEQRWTSDCLDKVGGLPWKPIPSDDLGGEVMPAIDMLMAEPEVEIRRPEYCEGEIVPRRLYLRTRDFKEHGATRSCKGCIAMARGGKEVPHTEACRKSMMEAIAETDECRERAEAAEARIK